MKQPSASPEQPAAMGAQRAASYVGIGESTLRRLARLGKAPKPVAIGGRRVWRRVDLDRWLGVTEADVRASDQDILMNG